jgi:hypothetical protein
LRELDLLRFFPRPPQPFFRPPRSDLFTFAHVAAFRFFTADPALFITLLDVMGFGFWLEVYISFCFLAP